MKENRDGVKREITRMWSNRRKKWSVEESMRMKRCRYPNKRREITRMWSASRKK